MSRAGFSAACTGDAVTDKEQAESRIAEIDAMFEAAEYWGSWMVSALQ
jgi:hypothetical protein